MRTARTLYRTREIKSGMYLPSRFAESNFTSLLLLKGTRVMCIHVQHVYSYTYHTGCLKSLKTLHSYNENYYTTSP